MARKTELRINQDITVEATAEGLVVDLTLRISGQPNIAPIKLSRAEAIKAGGDIALNGSSDRIPLTFESGDAKAFSAWLMAFAADA
ncbi:MAG: hypothetical protein ACRD3P_11845 [Terriglobales bacterium]